ncbi:hypothetical protein GCM10023340_14400 [Nocardioides marinquilinus]|uniref:CDP-alcohol phosphatidyltransferase family protein n=1 Tax=Nocardioides marinquilinus TaxID=1210400 RepID=A0ABP9PGB6_9ACTN
MTGHDDAAAARAAWSDRHGGLDPDGSFWVSRWVGLTHALARPVARRGLSPDVVTGLGLLLSVAVVPLAAAGAAWPLLAAAFVTAAGIADGVDGAVASLRGGGTRWGEVLDHLADRLSDLLLIGALVPLGAPLPLCAALAVLTLLLESVRAAARTAGLDGPGAVTVWERPSRALVAGFGTGLCGLEWLARGAGVDVLPAVDADVLATSAGVVGSALAVVGLLHLVVVVRRRLRLPHR